MAYRVVYESTGKHKHHEDSANGRVPLLTAVFLISFLLLVNGFWPRGREALQQILWPGDAAATRQAAECLVEDLRMGAPIDEALEAFCRDIIAEADLAGD